MKNTKQPLVYIYPPNDLVYPEFDQVKQVFSQLNPSYSDEAAPARGGFDFTPALHVSLKFVGEVAIMWILAGVGTDAYKALKSSLKKLLKIKPPRPSDWPKNIPSPDFVGIILQVDDGTHSFIIDFSFSNESSLSKALDSMPGFINSLSNNSIPTHHLILWDEDKWLVTHSQPLKRI